VRLTVLGCSGTFPGPQSGCSSYLVEADGFRLMIDAGNNAIGALQSCGDLLGVDAVLLSHLHSDHCIDLVAYAYARRYHPLGMPPALPVYGPVGTRRRLVGAFDHPPVDGLRETYDFRTVTPGRFEIGPFTVDLARVAHPIEAYGVRLTADGRTLTYSGDTGECEDLVKLARASDAFLCEASWHDDVANPPGVHLSGREAAEHAHRAGIGRLLLTHLVPWSDPQRTMNEATPCFSGEISLVQSCERYEI
jgi:ribonuclease BN (tRNA processing enzyme)